MAGGGQADVKLRPEASPQVQAAAGELQEVKGQCRDASRGGRCVGGGSLTMLMKAERKTTMMVKTPTSVLFSLERTILLESVCRPAGNTWGQRSFKYEQTTTSEAARRRFVQRGIDNHLIAAQEATTAWPPEGLKVRLRVPQKKRSIGGELTPKQQYTVDTSMTAARTTRPPAKKPAIRPELQTQRRQTIEQRLPSKLH